MTTLCFYPIDGVYGGKRKVERGTGNLLKILRYACCYAYEPRSSREELREPTLEGQSAESYVEENKPDLGETYRASMSMYLDFAYRQPHHHYLLTGQITGSIVNCPEVKNVGCTSYRLGSEHASKPTKTTR